MSPKTEFAICSKLLKKESDTLDNNTCLSVHSFTVIFIKKLFDLPNGKSMEIIDHLLPWYLFIKRERTHKVIIGDILEHSPN
jgi:hypothetical protein